MNPRDAKSSPTTPQRDLSVPSRDAAANLVRSQLDALYDTISDAATSTSAAPTPAATPKTPASSAHARSPQADQWQQYHTAWQEYYQKYYQQYYTGHIHKIIENERQKQPETQPVAGASATNESVDDLRSKIKSKVKKNASKLRKSRHFVPISAAAVVVFVFAFLQYNSVLIGTVQAYVSPGAIDPQNIVVNPSAAIQVGPEPKLIIPKINVDVPVVYGIGNDHASQMAAMEKGIAHFSIPGASSVPGQIGNTALAGHSSNDIFGAGAYKFIFAQLEKLENGDTIYANYEGTRYTYTVTKKEIVMPSEVAKLTYPTDKPIMTLITCWPTGTANKRLLVTAEQVSPDPGKAAPSASQNADAGKAAMPGNSATALERLFGRQ